MTDLTPLREYVEKLSLDASEDNYEAFLQAWETYSEPSGEVDMVLLSTLYELAVSYYMPVECTCDHEHEEA